MKEKKVLIIGAGLSGATAARAFADSGFKVEVWEKESYVGGTVSDYEQDGYFVQRHGPHLFHTSDTRAYEFLSRFTQWFEYRHTVRAFVGGKYIPVPFNFTSLQMLYPAHQAEQIKAKLIDAYGENSAVFIAQLMQERDAQIREFGQFVYDTVFKYYSAKQWGMDMSLIDPSVLTRVPVRTGCSDGYFGDTYQAMPMRGFSDIIVNMLSGDNITVKTGVNALERLKVQDGLLLADGEKADCPVVYTGCVDELMNFSYGRLPYRSLRLQLEEINQESYQPYGVVNYTVSEQFTRISEFKKFTAKDCVGRRSMIMKEFPCNYESGKGLSPYYPLPTAQAKALYEKYRIAADSIENLYPLGRLGKYVYINMDRAVVDALALTEKIIANYRD